MLIGASISQDLSTYRSLQHEAEKRRPAIGQSECCPKRFLDQRHYKNTGLTDLIPGFSDPEGSGLESSCRVIGGRVTGQRVFTHESMCWRSISFSTATQAIRESSVVDSNILGGVCVYEYESSVEVNTCCPHATVLPVRPARGHHRFPPLSRTDAQLISYSWPN